MALESVDYSEEKACKILEIVMQDDKNTKVETKQKIVEDACVDNDTAADASPPLPQSKSDARYLTFFFFPRIRAQLFCYACSQNHIHWDVCERGHVAFFHLFSH